MSYSKSFIADRSPQWVIGVGLAFTLLVALAERVSPAELPIWVLYFIPIGFVAWYGRGRWGSAIAIASLFPVAVWPERFLDPSTGSVFGAELLLRLAVIAGFLYALREGKRAAGAAGEWLRTDPSTGLANSRALFDLIAVERDRAVRYGRPFTIAYVGIDNLPAVRLRSGVDAVEELLRVVAAQIRGSIRSVDHLARLREREFAILLPETAPAQAEVVINRIRGVLSATLEGERHSVTYSIGAITWVQSQLSSEALHQRTYQLMYAARHEEIPARYEILDEPVAADLMPERRAT